MSISILKVKYLQRSSLNTRNLWQWINIIFNRIDEDRRKKFGPDRTCAEWILRNGGSVRFVGVTRFIDDYNSLPREGTSFQIGEVDATESSIMHYGFDHFKGCKFIETMKLDKCHYLENKSLPLLSVLNDSLVHLQLSSCRNISDSGLEGLFSLTNLKTLIIFDLPQVRNKEAIFNSLKEKLPQCKISYIFN